MWALLTNPGHADSFDHLGETYAPLRRFVEQLACRENAGRVYGVKSMATFSLTIAPTYSEAAGHDALGIEYNPASGLFAVGYSEWVSPTRNPHHRTAASRTCEAAEVGAVIDLYVLRLLLSRQPSNAESGAAVDGREHGFFDM